MQVRTNAGIQEFALEGDSCNHRATLRLAIEMVNRHSPSLPVINRRDIVWDLGSSRSITLRCYIEGTPVVSYRDANVCAYSEWMATEPISQLQEKLSMWNHTYA